MRFFGSLLAALLAISASSAANTEQLRGSPDPFSPDAFRRQQRKLQGRIAEKSGWYNSVDHGKCSGEICAVFGDPHVITCDGLAYDCQAVGLFTLMENHMFTIQGLFTGVTEENRLQWLQQDLPTFGSYLGDAVVKFKSGANDTHTPVLQIGFGDVTKKYPEFTSQKGCQVRKRWGRQRSKICGKDAHPPNANPLTDCSLQGWRAKVEDVYKCREKCEATEGCTKFNFRYNTYRYNSFCDLFGDEDADAPLMDAEGDWHMSLAGSMDDECGVRQPMPESIDEQERRFHGAIGRKGLNYCPLLLHLDGKLQDISHWQGQQYNTYIVGNKDSDFNVYMNSEKLTVQYTTANGDIANIKFHMGGAGPGERWNCHWQMETCLPRSDKALFNAWDSGAGLMGSPDGNAENDWMTTSGEVLPIVLDHRGKIDQRAEYDYCDQNWCVDRPDSLYTLPYNWTWDDIRCSHNPFEDIDIDEPGACVASGDEIREACAEVPEWLRYACELDCCVGGCDEIVDEFCLGADCDKLDGEEDSNDRNVDDECSLTRTGDIVCPDTNVVEILHTRGAESHGYTPDASQIIHDIRFGEDNETVQIKVNNPFDDTANIWVKHEIHSSVDGFLNDKCDAVPGAVNCEDSDTIEIACHNHEDEGFSFALVSVYFSSDSFTTSENKVDKCCKDQNGDVADVSHGVIEVTFEITCGCPASQNQ